MNEVFIKYNPYKLETEITINGNLPKMDSKLNVGNTRLQEWIDELPEILVEECNTMNFRIIFHGTILDYEDLVLVAKNAEEKEIYMECEHIPAKEVVDKYDAIDEIFYEIENGPFDELRQPDLKKAFQLAKSSEFPVNVVATMSAGKSTLINALLRQKLMPSKQEACTAIITEIKDANRESFFAHVYDSEGYEMQTHAELSLDIMESLNSNPAVSKIEAEGNIPFVSSDDISLVLVDTPGPNNSRDPEHKAATYRMLSQSSKTLVLYILNATQLGVNDDNELLNNVAESMSKGGKQSRDRFIFVVNKLDDFKKGEDSVEDALDKVRSYLEDKGIENPNVFPASALTALNIRTVLEDIDISNIDIDDIDDDDVYEIIGKIRKMNRNEEFHFENYAPLTPSTKGKIEEALIRAKTNKDKKEEALIHTGIVPIEMAISTYVEKYAKTAKIKNIVDTFSKKLESARSFENARQEIAENEEKHEEILQQIESIKKKMKSAEEAKKFKQNIDSINYEKEISDLSNQIVVEGQKKISGYLEKGYSKVSKMEAEGLCRAFEAFSESLQAQVKVKLEEMVRNTIAKNANDLLNQYKKRISDLLDDINVEGISIKPIDLISGDINAIVQSDSLINKLTETERVKVDEVWVENTSKKWWQFWKEKGHYKSIYADREYVDSRELAQRFFAPIQKQLFVSVKSATEYAKEQTVAIKVQFNKKFEELDEVLNSKLQELEVCAASSSDIEKTINETKERLKWLSNIQNKIEAILDI